ncbi:MAG: hypothetical protein JSU04_08695 [Bdellovibrionales bacterium]|nr:hypothetical protein [Bdellovibrionales bacterium]
MKISFFIFSMTLALGFSARAAVWQDEHEWNADWEQRYSQWVHSSFNEEVFVSGRYKGIETDCSDAVYAARVIFAYENKLPFVIRDSTGGGNRVSNKMSRFDGISDPLQRARRFIAYVGDVTSTKTMASDTYPVAINRRNVKAGTVWSRPSRRENNIIRRIVRGNSGDPGHAETVKTVSETGVLTLIGSTVPKAVRPLHTTTSMVFMPVGTETGLRNWMQPDYYNRSRSELPGYSMEQFNSLGSDGGSRSLRRWNNDVQRRLALREETHAEAVQRQVDDVCGLVNDRVALIAESEKRRHQLGSSCMDREDYDSYSTPSRDKRIKETLDQLEQTVGVSNVAGVQRYLGSCPAIRIAPGKSISLYDFCVALEAGRVSSNPNHDFEARWGLGKDFKMCRKY